MTQQKQAEQIVPLVLRPKAEQVLVGVLTAWQRVDRGGGSQGHGVTVPIDTFVVLLAERTWNVGAAVEFRPSNGESS